jgi:hypothetical protein
VLRSRGHHAARDLAERLSQHLRDAGDESPAEAEAPDEPENE